MPPFCKSVTTTLCFFFFSLLSLCLFTTTVSAFEYVYHICPNTTLFTPNGSYHRNLNSLLSSLSSNATTPSGFYNLTVGRSTADAAYGLVLCRGDVSADVCKDCVETAAGDVLQKCPKEKTSVIWYDQCMIRYSNISFFSTLAQGPSVSLYNVGNVSDPERFMDLMGTTIKGASERAVADSSGKKFATGEANFTSFQRLYTLVQCTPDLSSGDCSTCLEAAIGNLPGCCGGKLGGRVLSPSCNVRFEVYSFYNSSASPPPPPPLLLTPPPTQASTPATGEKGNISSVTIVAIVVPIVISVVLFVVAYCILRSRSKKNYNIVHGDTAVDEISNVESLQYDFSTICAATNNFSADNKLGEGGFGEVFKGTLPNGQEIAVKRLSKSSGQGAEEFKNEVVLVAKLQHRNLVRLLGFCLEGEEKILVYEFVPNKSLDHFLFDPEKRGQLDWSKRYKIIEGIARGILYLHEDSRLRIIHRDLKASNILLDGDMNPKISDFGMARIFGVDQTQGNTSRIVGTYGYMSPEYAMHGQFSVKSDVYSFGILILEIISGKKNSSFCKDGNEDLFSYAWKLWREESPLSLVDSDLNNSYSRNEVIRCIHIGLLCVQEDPEERPSLQSIVLMLNSYSVTLAFPHQPSSFWHSGSGFNSTTKETALDQSTTKSLAMSVDEVPITEVYPR